MLEGKPLLRTYDHSVLPVIPKTTENNALSLEIYFR